MWSQKTPSLFPNLKGLFPTSRPFSGVRILPLLVPPHYLLGTDPGVWCPSDTSVQSPRPPNPPARQGWGRVWVPGHKVFHEPGPLGCPERTEEHLSRGRHKRPGPNPTLPRYAHPRRKGASPARDSRRTATVVSGRQEPPRDSAESAIYSADSRTHRTITTPVEVRRRKSSEVRESNTSGPLRTRANPRGRKGVFPFPPRSTSLPEENVEKTPNNTNLVPTKNQL